MFSKPVAGPFPLSFSFFLFFWALKGAESYTFIYLSAERKSFKKKNYVLPKPFQDGEGDTLDFQPAWCSFGELISWGEGQRVWRPGMFNSHYFPEDNTEIYSVNYQVLYPEL